RGLVSDLLHAPVATVELHRSTDREPNDRRPLVQCVGCGAYTRGAVLSPGALGGRKWARIDDDGQPSAGAVRGAARASWTALGGASWTAAPGGTLRLLGATTDS